MAFYELTAEKISENYKQFEELCEKLDESTPAIKNMLADVGMRLAMCPASGRVDHHSCFPGGLVDHSLRVLQNAYSLMKSYKMSFPKKSVILSCLFHDLGKLGMPGESEDGDYYVQQKSNWHRERGMLYDYNNKIPYMTVPHRSIYILQYYDVKLTFDEMLAILLNDGQYLEANKPYAMKEPMLSMIVHQADAFSTLWEKQNLTIPLPE